MSFPAQHDHTITFAVTTGVGWVRLLVVIGALLVTAAAYVRPFAPAGRTTRVTVTTVAGCAVMLQLLLVDALDMPEQAVVGALAMAAVPIACTRHRTPTPAALRVRRVAPWVVAVTGALAAVELARWLAPGVDGGEAARLVHTSLVLGLVALSWLTVCRRAGRGARATAVAGWLVGTVVLAGATVVAVAT